MDSDTTSNARPPNAVSTLQKMLKRVKLNSSHMPHNDLEAARWWLEHQEPPDELHDRPEPISREGAIIAWRMPYQERVTASLRNFLLLSEPEKAYVVENIEAGIPWRGEPVRYYKEVIEVTRRGQNEPGKPAS